MANVDFGKYKRLVQYFWDPEPQNDSSSHAPIWCLGKEYKIPDASSQRTASASVHEDSNDQRSSCPPTALVISPATPPDSMAGSVDSALAYDSGVEDAGGWPIQFLDDFESKLWFTYRSSFPAIPKSQDPKAMASMSLSVRLRSQLVDQGGFTSDTGWGCMIRSGQSLLANSLSMLRLGKDWRRGISSVEERKLLSLFADDPRAPYSIHRFVEHGAAACGKHPGEWFGPSATARCIQALTNKHNSQEIRVYVTGDGSNVYTEDFMEIAKPMGKFRPTLILVGTRLGLDKITPAYWEALKATLQIPQSIGIAGGRPSSSHYFIGVQGDYLFYLDPHQTKTALPLRSSPEGYTQDDIDSCHTRRLRRIHIKEMDPSMLIAFLIHSEDEWKSWRRAVQDVQGKAVIHVSDRESALHGAGTERAGAIDEVESFDGSDDEETVLNV